MPWPPAPTLPPDDLHPEGWTLTSPESFDGAERAALGADLDRASAAARRRHPRAGAPLKLVDGHLYVDTRHRAAYRVAQDQAKQGFWVQ